MPRGQSTKRRNKADAKSPDTKKSVNESMESTGRKPPPNTLQLQKQTENDVKAVFNSVTADILKGGLDSSAVTSMHKRQLIQCMQAYPNIFQNSLLLYIERILTIDGED